MEPGTPEICASRALDVETASGLTFFGSCLLRVRPVFAGGLPLWSAFELLEQDLESLSRLLDVPSDLLVELQSWCDAWVANRRIGTDDWDSWGRELANRLQAIVAGRYPDRYEP